MCALCPLFEITTQVLSGLRILLKKDAHLSAGAYGSCSPLISSVGTVINSGSSWFHSAILFQSAKIGSILRQSETYLSITSWGIEFVIKPSEDHSTVLGLRGGLIVNLSFLNWIALHLHPCNLRFPHQPQLHSGYCSHKTMLSQCWWRYQESWCSLDWCSYGMHN